MNKRLKVWLGVLVIVAGSIAASSQVYRLSQDGLNDEWEESPRLTLEWWNKQDMEHLVFMNQYWELWNTVETNNKTDDNGNLTVRLMQYGPLGEGPHVRKLGSYNNGTFYWCKEQHWHWDDDAHKTVYYWTDIHEVE